jgi:hypothetical protein
VEDTQFRWTIVSRHPIGTGIGAVDWLTPIVPIQSNVQLTPYALRPLTLRTLNLHYRQTLSVLTLLSS